MSDSPLETEEPSTYHSSFLRRTLHSFLLIATCLGLGLNSIMDLATDDHFEGELGRLKEQDKEQDERIEELKRHHEHILNIISTELEFHRQERHPEGRDSAAAHHQEETAIDQSGEESGR